MREETVSQERLVIKDFNRKSREYSSKYSGTSSVAYSFITRRKRVCELLEECRGGKVLDIGCGPGVMVEYLTGKGFEVFGADISKEMVSRAKERYSYLKNCHFSVGKAEDLNFPDSYFDVVICMGVIEYIADGEAAISEMARVLKPEGVLIVTLPNKSSPYRWWAKIALNKRLLDFAKRFVLKRGAPTLIHREYTQKAFSRLTAAHGLSILDVVYYNFNILPFPMDRLLPGLAVSIAKKLETRNRGKLKWLGTGFVVKARKR